MDGPQVDAYRPLKPLRRVGVALLGVAVAVIVLSGVLGKPGGATRGEAERKARGGVIADRPTCAPGQTKNCVGGTAAVIVAPAAPASGR